MVGMNSLGQLTRIVMIVPVDGSFDIVVRAWL